MRPLFHRWFVEYNPIYLVSAALVLGGCFLLSQGLVDHDGVAAPLGIALVAEIYAGALVLGAGLLTRLGLRRPAVMLGLLSIVYQWDTTLHNETCAYLGGAGAAATVAWLAIFEMKVAGLAWALRVRFEPRALATAGLAALGLAVGPRLVSSLGERGSGAAVAVWLFALGALYTPRAIRSLVPLDAWGEVVLARVTRAAWALSAALVLVHVQVWRSDHALALGGAVAVAPLLVVRYVRSELRAWMLACCTLLAVSALAPAMLAVAALLTAAALLLRAYSPRISPRRVVVARDARATAPTDFPYRAPHDAAAPPRDARAFVDGPPYDMTDGEKTRLVSGAAFASYLALWVLPWTGRTAWPSHVLALDLALAAVVLFLAWRMRARSAFVPLLTLEVHAAVAAGLVGTPRSASEWGIAAVSFGFVLLGASLGVSYRYAAQRDRTASTEAAPSS